MKTKCIFGTPTYLVERDGHGDEKILVWPLCEKLDIGGVPLDKGGVRLLIAHLQHWLDTGSLDLEKRE